MCKSFFSLFWPGHPWPCRGSTERSNLTEVALAPDFVASVRTWGLFVTQLGLTDGNPYQPARSCECKRDGRSVLNTAQSVAQLERKTKETKKRCSSTSDSPQPELCMKSVQVKGSTSSVWQWPAKKVVPAALKVQPGAYRCGGDAESRYAGSGPSSVNWVRSCRECCCLQTHGTRITTVGTLLNSPDLTFDSARIAGTTSHKGQAEKLDDGGVLHRVLTSFALSIVEGVDLRCIYSHCISEVFC